MLNNDQKDVISKFISRTLDFLFVNNSKGTSFGVLFGIILKQISDLAFFVLSILVRLPYILCITFGIFIFNIPSLFRKHKVDDEIEKAMYYLKKAQSKGNFSEEEKRSQWRDIIELINKKTQAEPIEENNKKEYFAQKQNV